MMTQPTPPTPPGSPILSAQERAGIAQDVRDAQQGVRDAAQAGREAAQAARDGAHPGNNVGVVKDAGGRVVVTGPDGKTITIDPKAGLDGDQIQQMVQTALQPSGPPHDDGPSMPRGAITIVTIVFTFLFLIALVISRTVTARRGVVGSTTAALSPDATARLARIEQAVEAVAIEVERISEAQRYSAQLLTNRLGITPAPAVARTLDAPAARE